MGTDNIKSEPIKTIQLNLYVTKEVHLSTYVIKNEKFLAFKCSSSHCRSDKFCSFESQVGQGIKVLCLLVAKKQQLNTTTFHNVQKSAQLILTIRH